MAFLLGQVTQFDDAVSILPVPIMVAARAVNLPANKGALYQAMQAPPQAITQQSFEIRGRTKTGLSGLVGNGSGTGWTDGTTTTSLPVASAYLGPLTVGTVIKIEDEIVVVKDVDRSAYTIDVFERGAGSTTGAAHVDTTAYTVIGHAGRDIDLRNVESKAELTYSYTNYVQTLFETLDYTQFEQLIGRQALDPASHIALMRAEAMTRVSELLSVMAVKGVKRAPAAAQPPLSAGVLEQLADTSSGARPVLTYNSAGAFNETKLKSALETAFTYGNPDTIWVSQTNKNIINGFNQAIMISTDRTDTGAGIHVDSYNYEGKILQVKVDADIPNDQIPIVTQRQLQKGFMAGDVIRFVDEPKASSREHRESIQGSVGFLVEGVGFDHILIYGIS